MNPVQANRTAQINAAIARVPPDVRAAIVSDGIGDARTVLPVPYWSTVRVRGTVAANTLTVDTTSRKAFQYAVGQDMAIAGFAGGTIAQFCDTNLLRAGETLDNSEVYIWGLSAELCPNSEPALAARLWRDCIVELSLNGTSSIKLGTLGMFPSAGGLYGAGQSFALLPPESTTGGNADGGPGATFAAMANGNPMSNNFLKFPQPFKWSSVGGGGADASLSIIVTPNRQIEIDLPATRAAGAGVGAYTQPSTGDFGTFVDIRFRLVSVAVSKRSVNL
jgi:hypothetical protein